MMHRARTVAAGFADVGLTHAEELLRRMSPEGREQARRERAAKARRQQWLAVRLMVAACASLLVWALIAAVAAPGVALAVAAALMLLLTTLVVMRANPSAPGREALAGASLPCLSEEAVIWIAGQRRGLPPAALQLTGEMSSRLDELAPWISRLDPRSPNAAVVRKLIAVELPDLVSSWRAVPVSMRNVPHADGRTPDDRLISGLELINTELGRASERVRHGKLDGIAIQGRYLELKYDERDGS